MGLPSTVDGIDCAAIRVMGLRISKPIGAPSSCTVTFEDTTFVLPRTLGKLAELVVGPLSANRFVSNAAMKVGAYTLLNSAPADGPRRVTVRHTSIGDTDTLGTLTIVGTDADGAPLTETLAIGADTTVSHGLTVGSEGFLTVESITGAGWAVVGEPDRVTIGCKGRTLFRGQLTNCLLYTSDAADE